MAEVRALLIGLVLFSGIIVGMSSFYTELTRPEYLQAYGLNSTQIAGINPENISNRTVASDITNKVRSIETALRTTPTGLTAVDVAWGYINAALSAVTLPLEAIAYFVTLTNQSLEIIGIPGWVGGIVIAVILIIIIFEVLSAYMKWRI